MIETLTREELETIGALCRKWDALTVTDEPYEYILYDGREHIVNPLPGLRTDENRRRGIEPEMLDFLLGDVEGKRFVLLGHVLEEIEHLGLECEEWANLDLDVRSHLHARLLEPLFRQLDHRSPHRLG